MTCQTDSTGEALEAPGSFALECLCPAGDVEVCVWLFDVSYIGIALGKLSSLCGVYIFGDQKCL
jgi:hypothetical protein